MAAPRALRGGRLLVALFALGLVVRLVVLWNTSGLEAKIADERDYVRLADGILAGRGFVSDSGQPTSLRPPLYPALVAGTWSVAGPRNMQAVRAVQIVLAALTAWLVFELGRRAFDSRVGAWAAIVVWLYPELVFFNFTILTETLYTLLLVASVLLSVMLVQKPRASTAVACGLALGLGTLTRSVLWPLPFVLCPLLAFMVQGSLRHRVAVPALVLAGYAVVITPWAVRNTRLQGVVTIVDTMGGMNLRMGNYEHTPNERMWDAASIEGERNWVYALSQEGHPAGAAITEGQKEKWAQRKAIEYMLANPGVTVRRAFIKFSDFWGLERTFIAGLQHGLYSPPRWFGILGAGLVLLSCTSVLLFGVAGLWLVRPGWRAHVLLLLPVSAIMVAHTIVFGHPRYHVPLVPILALYACAVVPAFLSGALRRDLVALGTFASAAALLLIWTRQTIFVDGQQVRALFRGLM